MANILEREYRIEILKRYDKLIEELEGIKKQLAEIKAKIVLG